MLNFRWNVFLLQAGILMFYSEQGAETYKNLSCPVLATQEPEMQVGMVLL